MSELGDVDGDDRVQDGRVEQVLRRVLDAAEAALWSWDARTGELVWTTGESAPALHRGPRAEALTRIVHPDHHERVIAAVRTAVAEGGVLDLEFRSAAVPDERWLLTRGRARRDGSGRVVTLSGVLLDITDHALSRDEHVRLLHTERRARRRATALQRVAAALSEAATREQVAAVMVEESVRWLGADAARIELGPQEPSGPAPARPVVRTAGSAALLGVPAELSGGEPLRLDDTPDAARATIPLASRGRLRGRWTVVWRHDGSPGPARRDWSGDDGSDLLRTLATECAEALDRAELYEHQRDIATVLQRTLLPTVLPGVAGAEVAARYHPGGPGVDVGGDWYDVISLPGGRTGLVIGDVEGHSAEAAGVMGQVRNALRAYAMEGSTPAIVMQRLNRLLVRLEVSQLVTCCYLEFAAREGTATVVLAGHPPPLLLLPEGPADYVDAPPNVLLGVGESATFVETTVLLDPGACLLLYTDGLVEALSRSLPEGLAVLRGWGREWAVNSEEGCDELVELLVRRAREGLPVADDIAVLALRHLPVDRRPPTRLRAVRRTLPLDPTSPSAARRFVTDVLRQWRHDDLSHQVSLMASELVTNSVLHTTGELELGLYLDVDLLRVEVVDRSERLPEVQAPDDEATGGRGLLIIEALSRSWGVEARGGGKAVWFEVALEPPPGTPCVPGAPGGLG